MSGIIDSLTSESGIIGGPTFKGSVGISQGAWGTCFSMSSLDNGLYYFTSSNVEAYPFSQVLIGKGKINGTNRENWGYIKSGSYTNHRIDSGNFQVYHGITWAGAMDFYFTWQKIMPYNTE
jgi:hypothetical protein